MQKFYNADCVKARQLLQNVEIEYQKLKLCSESSVQLAIILLTSYQMIFLVQYGIT